MTNIDDQWKNIIAHHRELSDRQNRLFFAQLKRKKPDTQQSELYAQMHEIDDQLNKLKAQQSESDAHFKELNVQLREIYAQMSEIDPRLKDLTAQRLELNVQLREIYAQMSEIDPRLKDLTAQWLELKPKWSELYSHWEKRWTKSTFLLYDQWKERGDLKNEAESLQFLLKKKEPLIQQERNSLIALLQHKRILELQQQKLENIVDDTLRQLQEMDLLLQKKEALVPKQLIVLREQQAVLKQITEQSIPNIIDEIATDRIVEDIPPEIWDKQRQLVRLVEKTYTDVRNLILEEVSQTLPEAGPTLVSPFYGVRVAVREMEPLLATQQPISEILSQNFYFIADDWKALQIPDGLLNKSYEQLNTQELDILEEIIAQKRLALERGHVPSLRYLKSLNIPKDEALKHLFAFNRAIIHRRIQLFLSDHVVLEHGIVDSQMLQMEQLLATKKPLLEVLSQHFSLKLEDIPQIPEAKDRDMNVLLNKAWEQLNTQELGILKDIITQKRLALEQGHVPSLRELAHEALKEAEVLKQAEALKEAEALKKAQKQQLFVLHQAILSRRIQLYHSEDVIFDASGKVNSQKLQKAVDDLVEDLYQKTEEELSEADQYISQERDALEFAQSRFSQLQERWEIDVETFKNWEKQKYAQKYLAQAVSERENMLLRRGVSQQALLPRENPAVISEPDLAAEVISDTPAWLPELPGVSVEDTLLRFYITPKHIRKHIRDYGGDIDDLARLDMQNGLDLHWRPDRLHAVRTIISGRMEDIRQGIDLENVRDGGEKALTRLRVLRDTLTNQYISVRRGIIKGDLGIIRGHLETIRGHLEMIRAEGGNLEIIRGRKTITSSLETRENRPLILSGFPLTSSPHIRKFIGENKRVTIYFSIKAF